MQRLAVTYPFRCFAANITLVSFSVLLLMLLQLADSLALLAVSLVGLLCCYTMSIIITYKPGCCNQLSVMLRAQNNGRGYARWHRRLALYDVMRRVT